MLRHLRRILKLFYHWFTAWKNLCELHERSMIQSRVNIFVWLLKNDKEPKVFHNNNILDNVRKAIFWRSYLPKSFRMLFHLWSLKYWTVKNEIITGQMIAFLMFGYLISKQ